MVCFPNRLSCIFHKYIFSLCTEWAPVSSFSWDLSCCSQSSCVDVGLYLDNLSMEAAGSCACAGSDGRGDRTTQHNNPTHSLFSDPACISHLFKNQFGHFKFHQLYSGTDCSDFPAFLVNGCSAAHKVMAKGSQATFCVKPLWSTAYINIPWCKPHNCFLFQRVLYTLIICVYSFLPGWLLSSSSFLSFDLFEQTWPRP